MDPTRTIKFERRYKSSIENLWQLWTSKQGFESWWGPEGFRVEVRRMDPRAGGELTYDMIADGAEQIEFLRKANMPAALGARGKFVEVVRHERIYISHMIDFLPGVMPYENMIRVVFVCDGEFAHLLIDIDEHVDQAWTSAATLGMESQLGKVPAALEARTR